MAVSAGAEPAPAADRSLAIGICRGYEQQVDRWTTESDGIFDRQRHRPQRRTVRRGRRFILQEWERGVLVKDGRIASIGDSLTVPRAEELVFDEPTTGAQDDIQRCTRIAKQMAPAPVKMIWSRETDMQPLADHGEHTYVGHDRLRDKIALITGASAYDQPLSGNAFGARHIGPKNLGYGDGAGVPADVGAVWDAGERGAPRERHQDLACLRQ